MSEKAPFPYPEHQVEVDSTKEVPVFDAATYSVLMSLGYDEIESRAGEFGITPNSGIIPIEVDGQRRYIDTAVDDFGTNVRNVVEIVKQASPEIGSPAPEADVLAETLMAEHESPDAFASEADAELERQIDDTLAEALEGADNQLGSIDASIAASVTSAEVVDRTLQTVYHEINNIGYQNLAPGAAYRQLEHIAEAVQAAQRQIDANFSRIGIAAAPLKTLEKSLADARQDVEQKMAEHEEVRDHAEENGANEVNEKPADAKAALATELHTSLSTVNEGVGRVLAQANIYNQSVIAVMQQIYAFADSVSHGGDPGAGAYMQLNEMVSGVIMQTGESTRMQGEARAAVARTISALDALDAK